MIGRRGFLQSIGALVLGAAIAVKAEAFEPLAQMFSDGIKTTTDLMRGDLFTIEGVYAVNPMTYATTKMLQKFVVTADVTSGEYLDEDVIYPRIMTAGPYQNVSNQPKPHAKLSVFPGFLQETSL